MPPEDLPVLAVDWPAPAGVRAVMTTRRGGVSSGCYESLNLGAHVGDAAQAVHENRARLARHLGHAPLWLQQVHGNTVVDAAAVREGTAPPADAVLAVDAQQACAVLVADCLPVLLCTRDGRAVAAAHAGWRGLAAGVLSRTVRALVERSGAAAAELLAWLGPCIGPRRYEVGDDVRQAFGDAGQACFAAHRRGDGSAAWLCDLPELARRQLRATGIQRIHGGRWCTVEDSDFFSFRRDGVCGRMAAVIVRDR